jgi:tRNA modification GTPase
MREKDLIAALGTALGEAAISMIRLSGEGAVELVASIFKPRNKDLDLLKVASHTVTLGYICDDQGDIIDEVLVCVMRAPRTYTREDVVEIFCHGGILPVRSVMDLVLQKGARIAEPGEFTKRAFLNGRIDLAQAEAVLDLIRARSSKGAELACNQLTGKISAGIGKLRDELKSVLAQIEAEIDFPEDVDPLPKGERLQRIAVLKERVDLLLKGAGGGSGRGTGGGAGGGAGRGTGSGAGKGSGKGTGGGSGRGSGGRRGAGMGPGGDCICPSCGTQVPHQLGTPCTSMSCPKCGARMSR